MNANNDLMKLIIQSIKNDLNSRNPIHVNLALQCIANIGSTEMAESFGNEIPRLLVSGLVFMNNLCKQNSNISFPPLGRQLTL